MAYEKYGWSPMSGVCSRDWSLLMGPSPELYDVAKDPQQTHDLSGQSPETLQRMVTLLRDSRDRMSPKSARIEGSAGAGLKDLGYVVPSRSLGEKIPWEGGLASPARNMGVVRFETRGQAFWDEGAREAARKELTAGLEIDPDNLQLLNMIGLILMEEENWPEALHYFERLSQVERETCRGWVNRGVCQERMGDPVEAMACYRQATQKDASNWQAWFNGARILFGQKELSEASEWARQAQATAPSDERSVAEFERILAQSLAGSFSDSQPDAPDDRDGVAP
jgi:tetratricopeptide (TPR) repeat protein